MADEQSLIRWSEALAAIARTGLGFTQNLYEQGADHSSRRFSDRLAGLPGTCRRRGPLVGNDRANAQGL